MLLLSRRSQDQILTNSYNLTVQIKKDIYLKGHFENMYLLDQLINLVADGNEYPLLIHSISSVTEYNQVYSQFYGMTADLKLNKVLGFTTIGTGDFKTGIYNRPQNGEGNFVLIVILNNLSILGNIPVEQVLIHELARWANFELIESGDFAQNTQIAFSWNTAVYNCNNNTAYNSIRQMQIKSGIYSELPDGALIPILDERSYGELCQVLASSQNL